MTRSLADALGLVDGCPSRVRNTEAPSDATRTHNGWSCTYGCALCGHHWTTDWRD